MHPGRWSESSGEESSSSSDDEDPPSNDSPCIGGANQQEGFESYKEELSGSWDESFDGRGARNFGVICGNWGGDWRSQGDHERMLAEIHKCPGQVLVLQEASKCVCKDLQFEWTSPHRDNQRMFVVRGLENCPTTAVAARDHLFKGVKRHFFELQYAGEAKLTGGPRRPAFNRLMCCTIKCRNDYFREWDPATADIGIAVADMHFGCAKKTNTGGSERYKAFWDKLAQVIVTYKSRVLGIDANMALWCVVPELRARGLMVSMAAFFPSTRTKT